MAARAYWQGQIRLALVSIPVQVFSGDQERRRGSRSTRSTSRPASASATRRSCRASARSIPTTSSRATRSRRASTCSSPTRRSTTSSSRRSTPSTSSSSSTRTRSTRSISRSRIFVTPDDDEVAGEAYVVLRDALKATEEDRPRPDRRARAGELVALQPLRQGARHRDAALRRRDAEAGAVLRRGAGREAGEGAPRPRRPS